MTEKTTRDEPIEFGPGVTFHNLTVLHETALRNPAGRLMWACQCSCGALVHVTRNALVTGNTKSCGCRKLCRKHGGLHSLEYRVWQGMIARCTNPKSVKWHRYGGRGIRVCERWRNFAEFRADMGPRPSLEHQLDRINGDGNYEPGNCRWVTRSEQQRNRCNNVYVEVAGERMLLVEAKNRFGWPDGNETAYARRGKNGVRYIGRAS